jgi:hypothetical protein
MSLIEDLFVRFMAQAHPKSLVEYCEENGRIDAIEKQIACSPRLAAAYASKVVKGRWEEAEKAICEDAVASIQYAVEAIKGRFPAYEKRIMKEADKVLEYCRAIGQRLPEAEGKIAKSGLHIILDYVSHVVKGRFEAAEAKIITKPKWILLYSNAVGKKIPEMNTAMTMFSFQKPDDKVVKMYFKSFGP